MIGESLNFYEVAVDGNCDGKANTTVIEVIVLMFGEKGFDDDIDSRYHMKK